MRINTLFILMFFCTTIAFTHSSFANESDSDQRSIARNIKSVEKFLFGMPNVDFERRYLRDGTTPHNNQWDMTNWHPELWVQAEGGVTEVINKFYDSGVIIEQYEDEVPVLEVGETFMRLSPLDQRRVIEFVDYAFKITEKQPHGVFYVVFDHKTKGQELVGIHTINGLQFQ